MDPTIDVKNADVTETLNKPLNDSSPVTIKLILAIVVLTITILGFCMTIGTAIWVCGRWTGEIQTELRSISTDVKITKEMHNAMQLQINGHETRIVRIETVGSPNLQKISEQIIQLQRTMDLHMAQERKP